MRFALSALVVFAAIAAPVQASPDISGKSNVNLARSSPSAPNQQSLMLARELVDLLNPNDEYFQAMRETALAQIDQIENATERAASRSDMERYLVLATPIVKQHYPRIKEAYVQAYAREFEADELRQIIAFAATPAGRHFMDRYQSFDSGPDINAALEAMMTDLAPMYEDFYKARCQRTTARRIAAGETDAKCPMA